MYTIINTTFESVFTKGVIFHFLFSNVRWGQQRGSLETFIESIHELLKMTFIVPEKLTAVLKNFIEGKFESCLSSLEEVILGNDFGFLDKLRAETISVVCTFLSVGTGIRVAWV